MKEEQAGKRLLSNPEDVEKALKGQKTQIRRGAKYAEAGDSMEIEEKTFVFTKVFEQALGDMTDEDARAEGYADMEAYKLHLKNLHGFTRILPFLPWVKSKKVWVHEFREKN